MSFTYKASFQIRPIFKFVFTVTVGLSVTYWDYFRVHFFPLKSHHKGPFSCLKGLLLYMDCASVNLSGQTVSRYITATHTPMPAASKKQLFSARCSVSCARAHADRRSRGSNQQPCKYSGLSSSPSWPTTALRSVRAPSWFAHVPLCCDFRWKSTRNITFNPVFNKAGPFESCHPGLTGWSHHLFACCCSFLQGEKTWQLSTKISLCINLKHEILK